MSGKTRWMGLLVLAAGFLGAGCATTGKALLEQYQNVTPNRFEGAVAVVLENRTATKVDDDGVGLVEEGFKRIKLIERKGMDCGPDAPNCRIEQAVCYDETFDKVESIEARTITPEGDVIEVEWPKDMSDRQYRPWFASEGDMRCWVWIMKAAAPGAIFEYRYRTRTNEVLGLGGFRFQDRDPVLEASYSIDAPADYAYKWQVFNIDLQPTETKAGNRLTRTWTARDVAPLIEEEDMVATRDVIAHLSLAAEKVHAFGTVKSWEDLGNGWLNLIKDVVKGTDKLKAAAAEITKGAKTETEKAKAIWDFMQKNIRYVAIGTGLGGFVPISAEKVFGDKYGDCKAVAGLISVLGREVGLKADPILIGTRHNLGNLEKDLPASQFNHSIARVEADGKVYWLDATSRTEGFGVTSWPNQGVDVLVARPGAPFLDRVAVDPPEVNLVTSRTEILPGEGKDVVLNVELAATGNTGSWFRGMTQELNPEQWKRRAETVVTAAYPEASVVEQSHSDENNNDVPFVVKVKARVPNALQSTGAGLSLNVKQSFRMAFWDDFTLPKRRFPLDLGYLKMRRDRYEVKIPTGMAPVGLPKNVILEDEFLKVERLCQIEGDRVVVENTSVFKVLQIEPEKYQQARESFMKALDSNSFLLLFEPEKKNKKAIGQRGPS